MTVANICLSLAGRHGDEGFGAPGRALLDGVEGCWSRARLRHHRLLIFRQLWQFWAVLVLLFNIAKVIQEAL